MKKLLFLLLILNAVSAQKKSKSINLFNGKDFSGWHIDVPAMDTNKTIQSPFIIRNGMLVSLANPEGHIITNKIYKNYQLEVQYRFSAKPGNCGVLVHCSKPRRLYGMFPQSIEAQLMHENAGDFWCIGEDVTVPEMEKRRKGPKENWGFDEDKERQIHNLTNDSEKPVGEWNTMIIQCFQDKIKVWENGVLVNSGYNATAKSGQIALQAEGSEVEFRKVVLMPISKLKN